MNEYAKLKSHNSSFGYLVILTIGGILSLLVSFFLISDSLSGEYPQLLPILLGVFFGGFGLVSLISIFTDYDTLIIFEDRIEIRSILEYRKKIIYLKEIQTWSELDKSSKHTNCKELTIYTESLKYKLNSSNYKNYKELKSALVKGKTRDIKKEKDWKRKVSLNYAIGLSLFGGLFIVYALHSFQNLDNQLQASDLYTIKDVIINDVEVSSGAKGSRYIEIQLQSYPSFTFRREGEKYSYSFGTEYIANVVKGDTLYIDILKTDFLKKVSQLEPLDFLDKHLNYEFISIYGLHDKKYIYFAPLIELEENKKDQKLGIWISGGVGFFIIFAGWYDRLKNHL